MIKREKEKKDEAATRRKSQGTRDIFFNLSILTPRQITAVASLPRKS